MSFDLSAFIMSSTSFDKKLDDKKEDLVLMNVEKELWESGDWRENIKDLNSSFSKLPPIIKENRVKHGKSQAFVVE